MKFKFGQFKPWTEYSIGTRAFALMGGYWEKTKLGWRWTSGGCTFPTPGGDVIRVEEPNTTIDVAPLGWEPPITHDNR